MKKQRNRMIASITALALVVCMAVNIMPSRSNQIQSESENRMDGFTNDPYISSANYSANKNKYHSIFQMDLAGPGLTAWDYSTGEDVNVAIFDGGFDVSNEELSANIKGCYNALTDEEGLSSVDSFAHGTNCAKILGAVGNNNLESAGVAYNVNLYLIQVDTADGTTYSEYYATLERAIAYAASKKCRVISCSLSDTQYNADIEALIKEQYDKSSDSILFVASGGNSGSSEYRYPASYDSVLAVSALNYSSGSGYTIASSTYNDKIDLAAPGGTTSAATPYVAGTAALVFAVDPSLTASECAQILTDTATDAGASGYDNYYGYGIVSPLTAVQKAKYKVSSISRSISGVSSSYSKKLSSGSFQLSPKTEGSGVFTYKSSDTSVATVDSDGKVKLKGAGTAKITITIPKSGIYKKASYTTTVKVTSSISSKTKNTATQKATIKKVSSKSKKSLTIRWKKNAKADGYQIMIARNKSFSKGKKTVMIKNNTTTQKNIKKLKSGKKYYVKMRTYIKDGNTKVYGTFSKVKTVKIK